jgi:hypothetical protein
MNQNHKEIISKAVEEIVNPHGISNGNAVLESLREDIEVYKNWKKWHINSIEEILTIDAMEKADRKLSIGKEFSSFTIYMKQIWRRINDSIVWLMLGDTRHIMKRLYLYHKRGPLSERNFQFSTEILNFINSDIHSMAIWNDVTSCVDIGDITFINKNNHSFGFLELKKGKVNEEIIKMKETENEAEYRVLYNKFIEKYGKYGLKQLERCNRQDKRNKQVLEFIKNEKGVDPITN